MHSPDDSAALSAVTRSSRGDRLMSLVSRRGEEANGKEACDARMDPLDATLRGIWRYTHLAFGKMSNAEAREYIERNYGFTPSF
jgi:hypothetical protein